jgi:hypothetical protein
MGYNLTFEKLVEVLRRAIKAAVKVATVGPLPGYLPKPPADRYPGIGVVDGVPLLVGDRVLVKDQLPGFEFQNGLFTFDGVDLIRALEANEPEEIYPGALIPCQLGTSKDVVFLLQHTGVDKPVPGVDGLTFTSSSLGGGLSGVLASGNATNGNDLEISTGDVVRFEEGGGGGDAVRVTGPSGSMSSDYDIRLPDQQGGSGTVLQNDGSGNLSWASVPTSSVSYNAGEAISINQPLSVEWDAVNVEVRVYRSQANHGNDERRRVIGIALGAAAVGNPVNVHQGFGQPVSALFSVAPLAVDNGKTVYLSITNGFCSTSPPGGGGATVFEIGTLIGADGVDTSPTVVFAPRYVATF